MGDNNTTIQEPQVSAGVDAVTSDQVEITSTVQTQKQDSQTEPAKTPIESGGYTEEKISELLEKARADEKKKVFSKMESLKELNESSKKKLADLEAEKRKIEEDRDALREGKTSELKSVNEELSKLREQNTKLEQAFEASVAAAAEKIREQELKAYTANKIRESGLKLTELVSGDSEESIDESIKKAMDREKQIEETLREKLRKEIANDLPRPINIDGSQGRGPTPVITPQNREAVVRLKGPEYEKRFQELLLEAKEKAGLL